MARRGSPGVISAAPCCHLTCGGTHGRPQGARGPARFGGSSFMDKDAGPSEGIMVAPQIDVVITGHSTAPTDPHGRAKCAPWAKRMRRDTCRGGFLGCDAGREGLVPRVLSQPPLCLCGPQATAPREGQADRPGKHWRLALGGRSGIPHGHGLTLGPKCPPSKKGQRERQGHCRGTEVLQSNTKAQSPNRKFSSTVFLEPEMGTVSVNMSCLPVA